jgi:class 3 adenylate cyclase/tetratricopeptide (TPR) repeat protein
MDVAEWLRGLGLEQYAPAFRDNDIDGEVLRGLTADDLRELGVASIGHRRRLLDAIARLVDGQPSAEASPAPSAAAVSSEAERRQLTVMFCDLVGSTGLSARLDPEDLREIIAAYHRAVTEVVRGFDGFVAKYMGDGVLAYFGYPRAHEDDAERAVRAGLGVVAAVGRLDSKSAALQARIGIATGLVVVGDLIGDGSAQEQSVVGETPNLAARLQSLAEPNAVVISASTRRLVGDLFEYSDLGTVQVKGIDVPVPAWQVLRPSGVESRFEALHGSVLTPLVGRDEEIDLLLRRWARVKVGNGQVVLVSGEPGIGKSRITAALMERLHGEPHTRLRYFCSPYYQDSALFPFIYQLGRAAGFARDDASSAKLEKLETLLARAAPPAEDVAFLADLLSLPVSERRPIPDLTSQQKKQRTLEALLRQLEGLARQQPIVMVFEDAHWIDPTSRELLDLTVERLRTLPVLMLVTFRPEFQPPWTGLPQVTMLALNRLDRLDRTTLVARISGKALPDEVVDQIADRTDGVPLFVEELTKTVLESGLLHAEADRYVLDRALPPLAIPTTLHDSLMARLDRLDSVKRVAQIGAAIGREFPYTLLSVVSGLYEEELQAALGRLVASELVFQRGTPPDAVYSFKHALIQDAAHGSLLRSTRQQLHARIAETLETQFPEVIETQPEILAQHYAEAGLTEKSVTYWGRAGNNSAARSAMAEAAAQFQEALNQLELLPDTPERQRQELELCSSLALALHAVKGTGAPETGHVYTRARRLCEQLDFPSEFFNVLVGQSRYYAYRGELDLALRLDEELLGLRRQLNDSSSVYSILRSSGHNLMYSGKFAASQSRLEEAIALEEAVAPHDPNFRRIIYRVHHHPANVQAYLGNVLLILGHPDQALARSRAAIAGTGAPGSQQFLATSLAVAIRLLSLVGDNRALAERADQLVALSTEQGFPHWRAQGTIYRGWAKIKNGEVVEGTALLRAGSAAYRSAGSELFVPHYLDLQASACEIAGQIDEASSLLDDALQIVERTGERWLEAELNRHKGQLLLRQGHTEAAEELYHKTLSIAREQEAKLWELRAAVSLARLRRDQRRRTEARDLLAPVYGWFTEGFDTPDLKEAEALLDELA